MTNRMWFNGMEIVGSRKVGKYRLFILQDEKELCFSQIRGMAIEIECHECKKRVVVKFYSALRSRMYLCQSCDKVGIKNPFHGREHTDEFRSRLSNERKGKWYVGKNNSMWGVNVWDGYSPERAQKIKESIGKSCEGEKNPFYGKTHTIEVRNRISQKTKEYNRLHPERVTKMVRLSLERQRKGFQSSIEKATKIELVRRGIKHRYNKILHRKFQFDFIIGENLLLEVNGDYWHANPLIYKDREHLTADQQKKIELDARKKKYAEEYGYKIYYMWEGDIRRKDFSVIDQIVRENGIKENDK